MKNDYCRCKLKQRKIFMTICLNCCRFISPILAKKVWKLK